MLAGMSTATQPYLGRDAGRGMARRYKVYFADIAGRAQPELYEWEASGLAQADVIASIAAMGLKGVGFAISFPHITKIYRFNRTNIDVRAFTTPDMRPMSLDRGEGFCEFACLAESIIANAEFLAWAAAPDVESWFEQWVEWVPAGFANPGKLDGV